MDLKRQATLTPQSITLRFKENRIHILYKLEDFLTGSELGDAHLNFTPSDKLMNAFKEEIETAIKNQKK